MSFSAGGLLAMVLLALILRAAGAPEMPAPNLPQGAAPLAPREPLLITIPPLRLKLTAATLREALDDNTGTSVALPVELLPLSRPLPWQAIPVQLVRPDGSNPLRPDASYHLTLTGNWGLLALPWLKTGQWSAEYTFRTMPSPKPLPSAQAPELRDGEPLNIPWNIPVSHFDYRISPPVTSTAIVDPNDPHIARLSLLDYVPGQTYQIEIVAATGTNGVLLQRPYSLAVVMPKPPTPALAGSATLRAGESIKLRWDEPIVDFAYRLDPAASGNTATNSAIDPGDHHLAYITLPGIRQGQQYQLAITDATAENGLRLARPYTFTLTVPPPLKLAETTPGNDAFGISPTQPISLVFSEPIADRGSVEHALTITPALPGRIEWPSDRDLRFVPTKPLPFESEVEVRLAGGPESLRAASGSYLERDAAFSFTVRPDKLIDVDLTRQVVTLLEGGQVVQTSLTSTGVRGAETPTGTYYVQYKIQATRMRGVTPSGSHYDVPDVPWVLAFWGDYTLHGAYWRNGFGFPQSNGCVSLPVPFAKQLYYWAPRGTPVRIHY